MQKQMRAFTLVELIVVVTIVSILSTIGFVSYVDYLKWVRDSSRVQQLSGIYSSMELYSTRTKLPFPDDSIAIVAWPAKIWHQWNAGESVLEAIRFSDGGIDPKTKEYFTYMMSEDRKSAQLLWFFETQESVTDLALHSNILYADNTSLFPQVYGVWLGILIDAVSKEPVQKNEMYASSGQLDILTLTWALTSYISNNEKITWLASSLLWIVPNTNCKRLREIFWYSTSWIYKINPSWVKQVNVYCDMLTDGGGWTLVARSVLWASLWDGFGWLVERGDVFNDTEPYSMGIDVKDVYFQDILFWVYTSGKNLWWGSWKLSNIDRTILTTNSATYTLNVECENINNTLLTYVWCDGVPWEYKTWGNVVDTTKYGITWKDTNPQWLGPSNFSLTNTDINSYAGMMFVR